MAYINKAEILFSAKIGVGDSTPDLQQKTVTPSKETQIVTPDANYDGLSKVTVNPIPEGSGEGAELTPLRLVTFENNKILYPADAGADGFSKVEVAYVEDEKTVTPNENTQYIFPDDGKVLKMVTVNPIPPNSGSDISVQQEKIAPITSDADGYAEPATIYPDDGYDAMESVVVYFPEHIDASKIKKGEKILGVTGTYEASGNSIIVGKWVFHNVVTQYPPETVFDVNFKCDDNTECNRIATSVANGTWQMVFWDADDGAMLDVVVNGRFRSVVYQTIDFGTIPQTIPAEFAEWLAANADYEASGGASCETVPVTIVDGANLYGSIMVSYTGLDDNGKPESRSVEIIHADWYGSIDVVKGTRFVIYDLDGGYRIGYDSRSGFDYVEDFDGTALICAVGDVPCEITPSQIELTDGGGSGIET